MKCTMEAANPHSAPQSSQAGHLGETPASSQSTSHPQSSSAPFPLQRSEESWVEVGSRPSSSSLSSAADEIITTGLRVQHDSNTRRRRRARAGSQFQLGAGYQTTNTGDGSSQEEYEESESESDRVLTSSTEGIGSSPLQLEVRRPSRNAFSGASSETLSEQEGDDKDDENATTVNYPRSANRAFVPRPNAFTHPSSAGQPTYAVRRPSNRPSSQRHMSYPQHSPYNAVSPSYQADHDEALRASLSTLLSAAAAVRGRTKPGGQPVPHPGRASTRVDPSTLRLVPESVALGRTEDPVGENTPPASSISSPQPSSTDSPFDKSKRKSAATPSLRSSSKDRRVSKKARKMAPILDEVSPTLLTWVVSAGVVVLVSALSFSAGYAIGREAGHAEAVGQLGSVGADAGRCGKEAASGVSRAGLGLRRLRWSGASGVRV